MHIEAGWCGLLDMIDGPIEITTHQRWLYQKINIYDTISSDLVWETHFQIYMSYKHCHSVLSINILQSAIYMGAQWSTWLETEGRPVRASPVSLCCGPGAKHIYPSLVLVQPRKTHPCLTERLLSGRKESNQTNKQNKRYIYRKQKYIFYWISFEHKISTARS